MDAISWIKNNIGISSILPVDSKKYSDCPFCDKRKKWVSVKDKKGKCYSVKCPSNKDNTNLKDVIELYKIYHDCDTGESIKRLSKGYQDNFKVDNPYFDFNERLASLYHKLLLSGDYPEAVNYLKSRNINNFLIKSLKIGFAPEDKGIDLYIKNGFTKEELKEFNIINNNYLYFRDRIIFPIKNTQRKIVHFQGRYIHDIPVDENGEEVFPKYIATKTYKGYESIQNYLYLEDKISYYEGHEKLFICEGVPDTIAMLKSRQQALGLFGLTGLVNHAHKLVKFKTIYICGDNDTYKDITTGKDIYKSWEVLIPQIKELQLLLPNTEIRLFKPPKSIEGKNIKDMEEMINYGFFPTVKDLEDFIDKTSSSYLDNYIKSNLPIVENHLELIRMCKICNRGLDKIEDYLHKKEMINLDYILKLVG